MRLLSGESGNIPAVTGADPGRGRLPSGATVTRPTTIGGDDGDDRATYWRSYRLDGGSAA